MAGISNLGNFNVKQAQQLSKTAEIDTQKAEDKGVGDAKPAAVWINNWNGRGPTHNIGRDVKLGDVMISIEGDKVHYHRLMLSETGDYLMVPISADDVMDRDYETDRGDIRRS